MFDSPKRNHFTIIFERLAAVLAFFAVFFINSLQEYGWEIFRPGFYTELVRTALNGGFRSALMFLAFFVFVIVCMFLSYRYWLKTYFYIESTDFIYKRNTLFKVDSRLPVQNIATVNVERNIFERFVGTAKVKIDLNSSRTASKTDFKFVLKREDALSLKEALLSIKARQSADAASPENLSPEASSVSAAPSEVRRRLITFTAAEAFRHKLLSFPIIQSVISVMLIVVLPMLKIRSDSSMNRMLFLLLIAVGGSVLSIVKGAFDLGNYTVEQDSKMLYINCGLLNKRNYAFERGKINAVIINEPVLSRLFGLCSVSLAVVGFGNEKNETTHLSLTVKKKRAIEIISECVPDFVCKAQSVRAHPFSLFVSVLRAIFWGAATMLLGFFYNYAYIMAAAVFVLLLIGAVTEFAGKYYAADENIIYYSGGIFNRSQGMFKYENIQDVRIKTNIFLRKANLGRMSFSILSAAAMKKHKTGLFDISLFDKAADRVVEAEDKSSLLL
jgi:putative membrane protein